MTELQGDAVGTDAAGRPRARTGSPRRSPTEAGGGRVAHIGGEEIAFDERVLEPRPWTVLQSEWAAELAPLVPSGPILEVCCGVGHIGLIAAKRSGRSLVQVDCDPHACAFARANAAQASWLDRVEVRCADLAEVAARFERYPLVIADPPYVATAQVGRYPEDPLVAIDGGEDGLDLARSCLDLFRAVLDADGRALLQLGSAVQVEAMADAAAPHLELLDQRSAGPTRHLALFGRAG